MLIGGFVGGHVLDEVFYHPGEIAKIVDGHLEFTRPWSLLFLWEGLSSFGGFTGALFGAFLWRFFELRPIVAMGPLELRWFRRRTKNETILPLCDLLLSVFPVAWIFGRAGCSVARLSRLEGTEVHLNTGSFFTEFNVDGSMTRLCVCAIDLFVDAPEPVSSSVPIDVTP